MVMAEPEVNDVGEFSHKQPLVVTGSRDRTVCVWALPRPGDPEHKDSDADSDEDNDASANNSTNPYHIFRMDGHGRKAASASYDCTVRIWDIVAGQCLFILRGHTGKG
jgi:F-box and WD-40 domain protein CDC4